MTRYSQITPLDIEWLWQGKAAYGTVTGVFGAEGIAKGFLECKLTALITTGQTLPGNEKPTDAGSVIMVTPEDDVNITMYNRLHAAGANMDKVEDMTEISGAQFMLPESLPALREKIYELGDVRAVFIDPLGDVSSIGLTSSVVKVRQTLTNPLIKLAEDTGVAIFLVQHTTKDGKKLQGSGAIRQALRSVLRIARDTANPAIRVISVDKSNAADDSAKQNVRYTLEGEGKNTRVKFLGVDSDSAEDVTWLEDKSDDDVLAGWSREAGQSGIIASLKRAYPESMPARDLATRTGNTYIATRVLLHKLAKHGDVIADGNKYRIAIQDTNQEP